MTQSPEHRKAGPRDRIGFFHLEEDMWQCVDEATNELVRETEGFWEGDGRMLVVDTGVMMWALRELARRVKNVVATAYKTIGGEEKKQARQVAGRRRR